MKRIIFLIFCLAFAAIGYCQKKEPVNDTLTAGHVDSIIINAYLKTPTYLPDVIDMNVFSGKKTNMLNADNMKSNLSANMARIAFAQIPGLNMWEMDGAGTQVNIGSRGTDAHRSIEMNMRQNGYNTNSDMFGYPEDHYTPSMQGIQQVQLVRGSAALQFGSQFGGMFNYVMKEGDTTKPFAIESEQTAGGNNFFNSYNAVGGTTGKLQYYAYYDARHGDGWRDNAKFNYHAYYANLNYHFSSKASLAVQFSRMNYVQQIAGGLTDAQFQQNPQQSLRSRNFFNPEINIPALIFKYSLSERTKIEVTSHALFGQRNSVQFIANPDIKDTFNTTLNSYNPRQVDRDYYNAFTTEARILHQYNLGRVKSTVTGGLRYSTEVTKRKQKGVGTTGSDFDLSLVQPYGIDLRFNTHNYAVFAENIFQLTSRFSVTPGFRYEVIQSQLSGVINNASSQVNYKGKRDFPLFGAGLQYQASSSTQFYGNISQAYRPYLYANFTPATQVDKIDPSLKDSKGYDIDLGYRGNIKNVFRFDVNAYYLYYGNRVGLLTEKDVNNNNFLLTTNIGNSVAKGVEAFLQLSVLKLFNPKEKRNDISIFHALTYTHARYTKGTINKSGVNTDVTGNHVENSPDWINKTGISFQHKNAGLSIQYSAVSKCYNDAFNTLASNNGVIGVIPAYHLWDVMFDWQIKPIYHFSAGINNFTNEKYFNRRITMYPGPGILPADGRTFYVSFGVKI